MNFLLADLFDESLHRLLFCRYSTMGAGLSFPLRSVLGMISSHHITVLQTLYDSWLITLWPIIFTAAPPMYYGVQEQVCIYI